MESMKSLFVYVIIAIFVMSLSRRAKLFLFVHVDPQVSLE